MDIGEQCDDGNTAGFDGCSSTCGHEPNEDEPNFPTENAKGPFTDSVTILAAISPVGDEDVFKFTNQRDSIVRVQFDTWNRAFP